MANVIVERRGWRTRRGRRELVRSEGLSWKWFAYATIGVFVGLIGSTVVNKIFPNSTTLQNTIAGNQYGITWTDAALLALFGALAWFMRGRALKLIFAVAAATVLAVMIDKVVGTLFNGTVVAPPEGGEGAETAIYRPLYPTYATPQTHPAAYTNPPRQFGAC